ncbi:MAG: PAC2 family protein [Crenarchaeota archaeon]|nr:PAC2 family protein [Thermoproteota archaeon]MDA1124239.1 PAC2 family protein [Thermoproteota archaeon]
MQSNIPEAEIYEIGKNKLKNPTIFVGFVGAGLVGTIAVDHMINELDMKEVGFLRSKHLPPLTVFMQGRLRHPFRIYSNNDGSICAIICEVIISKDGVYNIAMAILDWAEKKGSNEIIVLDGVADKKHDGNTFFAAEVDMCRVMEEKNIQMIPHGFIAGISGGILNECLIRKIRGITLLVKANESTPDPMAAATIIDAVNRIYKTKIDTKNLKKQKKQIGVDLKELSDKYSEHKKIDSNMYM